MSRLKPAYQIKSFDSVGFASPGALGMRDIQSPFSETIDTPCPLDRVSNPDP